MGLTLSTGKSEKPVRARPLLDGLATLFATGLGVGTLPVAPGTAGSLLGGLLFLAVRPLEPLYIGIYLVISFLLGVAASSTAEFVFKEKDSGKIVIDEIVAMQMVLFSLPPLWTGWVAGFILFRLFDILKPYPIRNLEKFPRGWGIMLDDVGAAGYTLALLFVVQRLMKTFLP